MPLLVRLAATVVVGIALWSGTSDMVFAGACVRAPASPPALPRTRVVQAPPAGFQWRDAAIGSIATLALLLLGAGGAMTLPRDRTGRR
jgi:hypothetical protein